MSQTVVVTGEEGLTLRSQTTRPTTVQDAPILAAADRKLRHLHGISIRNLNLKPSHKQRTRSNDDESVPTTWRSPSKLLARMKEEDTQTLSHSRSSTDLVSIASNASASLSMPMTTKDKIIVEADDSVEALSQKRPSLNRMKRRSTRRDTILFGSVYENAAIRNKRLEDVTIGRMADCFVSLHHPKLQDEPIYVSETLQQLNPSFKAFDVMSERPEVSRLDSVIVRVWARRMVEAKFVLLVELDIALRHLQFIGRSLENFKHPFPENCIIFYLKDGFYTSFTDLPMSAGIASRGKKLGKITETKVTSSYGQLMKLKNLMECINDANNTQAHFEEQMNSLLQQHEEDLANRRELQGLVERLKDIRKAVNVEKKRYEGLSKQQLSLVAANNKRRNIITQGREAQHAATQHLNGAKPQLEQSKQALDAVTSATEYQRQRILDDLQVVYPIEHKPLGEPLNFTICKIHLPNNSFDGHDEDDIAAALGYVAHIVLLLSFYLGVYLRYPIAIKGSQSHIEDPISTIQGSRTFPLYIKGSIYYRFEYAVFLLNKDIEQASQVPDVSSERIHHHQQTAKQSRQRSASPFPSLRKTTRAVTGGTVNDEFTPFGNSISQSLPRNIVAVTKDGTNGTTRSMSLSRDSRNSSSERLTMGSPPFGRTSTLEMDLKKVLKGRKSILGRDA